MQSPTPAATAKNFGLPLFRVIVGFCGKPWRDVHGHGETSATAGCLSATAVVGSVRLHPLAPFLALTESFPPGSDSTAATWGSTWLPREMAFLICVAGLQQAWHRGNIYISFCNVVTPAAILGTEALAGSGERERGTKHTVPCRNQSGRWRKKKKNRQPASFPGKLVVFLGARGAACPPDGCRRAHLCESESMEIAAWDASVGTRSVPAGCLCSWGSRTGEGESPG